MKSRTGAVVVVLAALVGGLAFSQNPPVPNPPGQDPPGQDPPGQDPAVTRIEKLEADLAAAKLRIEALSTEVADAKKQMTTTVQYVENQAKAAAAMAEVLDQSEREGFTYGINPDSRHTMLRGWRELLATAQQDVPELEAPPPPAAGKRVRKP